MRDLQILTEVMDSYLILCQRSHVLLACGRRRWQQWYLHTFARIPLPPCPIIMDTMQQNCRGGNGAESLKNSESNQTKWVDRHVGCGGEVNGSRAGVAVIFFL